MKKKISYKVIMWFILLLTLVSNALDLTYFPAICFPHYEKQFSNNFELRVISILDEQKKEINLITLFKPNELHFFQYTMKYLQFDDDPSKVLKFINFAYNKQHIKNKKKLQLIYVKKQIKY
jgi:hypothetical protein